MIRPSPAQRGMLRDVYEKGAADLWCGSRRRSMEILIERGLVLRTEAGFRLTDEGMHWKDYRKRWGHYGLIENGRRWSAVES